MQIKNLLFYGYSLNYSSDNEGEVGIEKIGETNNLLKLETNLTKM